MHGTMGRWYEILLTGPGREQFRLFCLLENGTSDELARRWASPAGNRRDHGHAQALADSVLRARLLARAGARPRTPAELIAPHRDLSVAVAEKQETRNR